MSGFTGDVERLVTQVSSLLPECAALVGPCCVRWSRSEDVVPGGQVCVDRRAGHPWDVPPAGEPCYCRVMLHNWSVLLPLSDQVPDIESPSSAMVPVNHAS